MILELALLFTPVAQGDAAYRHDAAPLIRAAPARRAIRIDGALNESDWTRATPAAVFTQLDPHEGEPASERTEVRVLVGEDALYIGARLYDREPHLIVSRLGRRDAPLEDGDAFSVFLDSYHDHLTAAGFSVTPAGAVRDVVVGADGEEDASWDGVWDAAAAIDSLGWTVEIRIPLSQLRYRRQLEPVWGIQLSRRIKRKQEVSYFAFTPKAERAGINRYGHLSALRDLTPRERLDLVPHVVARAQRGPESADAGLEARFRVSSGVTLNATVNPDFGQVEADPAVVNLTAFETRYEEKRPFFVEGAEFFRFGRLRAGHAATPPRFFFSRRIGREPTLSDAGAPEVTTIVGAAKLTGKTHGWSIGLLNAVTAAEHGRSVPVEPLTNYFSGRVTRELRQGNTTAGMFATAVNRDVSAPDLADELRSDAYAMGLDLNHTWGNRMWALDASIATSTIRGSPSVINDAQRSSARYYQRPDASHLEYDPSRTSLAGHAAQLAVSKIAGLHWRWSAAYQEVSPGLEVNDLGFQRDADRRVISGEVEYRQQQPTRLTRNWRVSLSADQEWNFGGERVDRSATAFLATQLHSYWSAYGTLSRGFPSLDDRLTRGGPMARDPGHWYADVNLSTDDRKRFWFSGEAYYLHGSQGGWSAGGGVFVSIKPAAGVKVRFGPYLSNDRPAAQLVTRVSDTLAAFTYGRRYVFATLDQPSASLSTRLDWTFSPRLSLQVYSQLFVGAGNYYGFKELTVPRTFGFSRYGDDRGTIERDSSGTYVVDPDGSGPAASFSFADPDFNARSLRGTMVLRWEYRPGSTLFLAWQHRRSDSAPVGDLSLGRDLAGLWDAVPTNILVLKASYWLGL